MYSSLRVVAGPAKEAVSLEDARRHLRVDHTEDDDLIKAWVAAARTLVEAWSGRSLITQTLLWTMSQDPPSGALPLLPMPLVVLPVILSAPQVMNRPLELPRAPVQAVQSVSQADLDGAVTVVSLTDYVVDLAIEPARLRLCWSTVPRWLQHIQVQFTTGYGDTPAAVPAPLIAAVKLLIGHLYENRGDTADLAGAPPRAIDYLLTPYKVGFFGG